jgi:MipA family protein
MLKISLFCSLVLFASDAFSKDKPVLEVNAVTGVGMIPDYPGANQAHIKYLALPFITYRGETIKSDLEGVKADVVKKTKVAVDASLSGSLPTSSKDNDARAGMPNLDTMIEVGPSAYVLIPAGERDQFRIQAPLRAVYSTDFKRWVDRGFIFAPGFLYKHALNSEASQNLTVYLSVNFMTKRLNNYFYEVDQPYVTNDRPLYRAHTGYTYSHLSLRYDIEVSRFKFFVMAGAQNYSGSANAGSPLHKAQWGGAVVGAVIISFFHSAKTVPPPPL